jgi:hypothetical protein
VILEVDTAAAEKEGIAFHQATDLIWLCPALPADVVRVPELPEAAPVSEPVRRSVSPPAPTGGLRTGPDPVEPSEPEGFQRRKRRRGSGGRR